MDEDKLLPLAILHARPQQRIDSATQFQKLIFLTQEETDFRREFEFLKGEYGPVSHEVAAVLEVLSDRGLIEKSVSRNRSGMEKHGFSLTSRGEDLVEDIRADDGSGRFEALIETAEAIIADHGEKPVDRLMKYVYHQYPEYSGEPSTRESKPVE